MPLSQTSVTSLTVGSTWTKCFPFLPVNLGVMHSKHTGAILWLDPKFQVFVLGHAISAPLKEVAFRHRKTVACPHHSTVERQRLNMVVCPLRSMAVCLRRSTAGSPHQSTAVFRPLNTVGYQHRSTVGFRLLSMEVFLLQRAVECRRPLTTSTAATFHRGHTLCASLKHWAFRRRPIFFGSTCRSICGPRTSSTNA